MLKVVKVSFLDELVCLKCGKWSFFGPFKSLKNIDPLYCRFLIFSDATGLYLQRPVRL